jgi:hypothetical protein
MIVNRFRDNAWTLSRQAWSQPSGTTILVGGALSHFPGHEGHDHERAAINEYEANLSRDLKEQPPSANA